MNQVAKKIIDDHPEMKDILLEFGEQCALFAWQDRLNYFHQDFFKWWHKFTTKKDEEINSDIITF